MKIASIVLAAGQSSRMGQKNKLLMDWNGRSIISRVVETSLSCEVDRVIVVTGHDAVSVQNEIASQPVDFLYAANYALGLSESLKVGIANVTGSVDGALICLGDMPQVHATTLNVIIQTFKASDGSAICTPYFKGCRGNPILWPQEFFSDFAKLDGDKGALSLLQRYGDQIVQIDVTDPGVCNDIDTPDDLARCRDWPPES